MGKALATATGSTDRMATIKRLRLGHLDRQAAGSWPVQTKRVRIAQNDVVREIVGEPR